MWVIERAVIVFFNVLDLLIFARIIMSWFNTKHTSFYQTVHQLTEPILAPFRNLLIKFGVGGTIDFSPILALIALNFAKSVILKIL